MPANPYVLSLVPGQIGLSFGTWANPDNTGAISEEALPADGTHGQVFAIPRPSGISTGKRMLTWETRFSGAPSGVSVAIEGSFDNSVWETLATSTNTSGESKDVDPMDYPFIRATKTSSTGGTGIAVLFRT